MGYCQAAIALRRWDRGCDPHLLLAAPPPLCYNAAAEVNVPCISTS